MASWYGILAPAGTPQDIVRKLNADINGILQAPDVSERLTALGTEPTGGTPEQFAETIKADTARWAKVVSDAEIRIDQADFLALSRTSSRTVVLLSP